MIAQRVVVQPIGLDEWLSFESKHPAPTFFARPSWALALTTAFPHLRPHPVLVETKQGLVLVPLVQNAGNRLGWRELTGMPLGTYTCALHEDGRPASAETFSEALCAIGRGCDAISVTPWPLASATLPPAWRATRHETAVIDLADGADAAIQRFDGVSRRMAGQALRRGVVCAPCDTALASSTYYGMLREAAERWGIGRPTFPKELLDALLAYGAENVEIWFAQCDGHAIAGGVVLYGASELFFWSAAMRQNYARLRPSNALNAALIRAAADRGIRWYNLGASEGLPGVERFKRGLGASTVDYAHITHDRLAFSFYRRLRSSVRRPRSSRGTVEPSSQGDL